MPYARASENRKLAYALLLSVAFHGAVLLFAPPLWQAVGWTKAEPAEIIARLVAPPARMPEAEKPSSPKVEERRLAPRAENVVAARKPAPAKPDFHAPASIPPEPSGPKEIEQKSVTQMPSTAPRAEVRDARSLGEYRMELIGAAKRYKRYPEIARENNWAGSVVVSVSLHADGRTEVSAKSGSGHEVLDRQALEMFRQAASVVPIPAALRGKELSLEVRAIYGLED